MNPESADQYLVEQINRGNEDAWRQIIDRYTGRLLAFARARTQSLSDAEDLVQETLVGFIQSLSHYDSARSLETYLFTILRYKLYDWLRQRKVTVVTGSPESEDWWGQTVPADTETPSGAAVQAEAQRRQEDLLADVLLELIRDYRDRGAFQDLQVVELVFFAGRRNLDAAEMMGIDQKAVAGIKFRAIQKLQKFLHEKSPETLSCLDEPHAEVTASRVWRERRLTCLKRSTIGSYLLGVLEEPWRNYTQFHLDVVGCEMCLANLADLESERDESGAASHQQMFQSSVGFLKRST